MSQGRVGRADLITALGLGDDEFLRAAALVGYEPKSAEKRDIEPTEPRHYSDTKGESFELFDSQLPSSDAVTDFKLRAWRVIHYERLKPPPVDPEKILTRPELPRPTSLPPRITPLAPARSLLVRLRHIWQRRLARGIDINAAIQRVSLGEILVDLPKRQQRKWGRQLQIIADRSERLVPYWADQDYVVRALLSLFPSDGVGMHVVSEIDDRAIASRHDLAKWSHSHLLVLGDLGALEQRRQGVSDQWIAFGERVRRGGGRPLALIPCSDLSLCPELRDLWQVINWEPTRRAVEIADPEQQLRTLHLLQVLLAKAIRLEPGLVRQMRRILPTGSNDAALESLFWQDDALIGTSESAATWHPTAANRLREQFDHPFHPRARQLRQQALRVLKEWRSHLPAEVFFEELLEIGSEPSVIAELEWNELYQRALTYFRWLKQHPDELLSGGTVADWFGRLEQRLSPDTWKSSPVADQLAHLWSMAHRDDPHAQPPPYLKTVSFDNTQSLPERTAVFREGSGGITVRLAGNELSLKCVIAEIATRNALLTTRLPFWIQSPGPSFARRLGRDDFGPWFEFEIENKKLSAAVQRMRWIPAGGFLMGSPDTEAGRWDNEGPRHQVTFTNGFWIFDTPCTQQVWRLVMGEDNPSRFVDPDRPVEQVDWNRCGEFCSKLSELVRAPFELPTEAQWEYACRAGTQATTYAGQLQILGQCNAPVLDAIAWYAGNSGVEFDLDDGWDSSNWPEKQFDHRQAGSRKVAQKQPNDWGLYDMLGNVWEWCRDGLREYSDEAVTDPMGSVEKVADRVIRGGSWDDHARDVRAACRHADGPGNRDNDLGFRCVWVQSAAQPIEVVRSERAERGAEPPRIGGAAAIRISSRVNEFDVPDAPRLLVRSDCEQLELDQFQKPDWASAFGRDRFGLWVDFTIQNEIASEDGGKSWIFSRRGTEKEVRQVTQRLRWIPPGQMMMGSPTTEGGRFEDEGPQHRVTISRGFWMFDTPCTQELWQLLMTENPSRFRDPHRPVESVDWHQARHFARRLSDKIPELVFSLPTEAQWEYSCRAGTNAAIYSGSLNIIGDANAPELDPIAWYGGNSGVEYDLDDGDSLGYLNDKQFPFEKTGTRKVKLKKPNPWGLYDMLGNVWEWCQDGQRQYSEADVIDPRGSMEEDAARVIRGGSWGSHARLVRAAYRNADGPGDRSIYLGFRCVCIQSPSEVSASNSSRAGEAAETQRTE